MTFGGLRGTSITPTSTCSLTPLPYSHSLTQPPPSSLRSMDRVESVLAEYHESIAAGRLQGAYAHALPGGDHLLFTHSGLRAAFLAYLRAAPLGLQTAPEIAAYVNEQVVRRDALCEQRAREQRAAAAGAKGRRGWRTAGGAGAKGAALRRGCDFEGEVFQAGADRGGASE